MLNSLFQVAQEKNKLIVDIKRLKEHFAKYEPTILELKKKYETAMKEKMLVSLERDKVQAKVGRKGGAGPGRGWGGVGGAAVFTLTPLSLNPIPIPS